MFLANISVRKPVLMTMVILSFVVLGLFSYFRLVIDLFPEVEFPIITVTTLYPGAGPLEVETQVTKPIEDEVSSISNVKKIESTTREALSLVLIEFELGVDVDIAAIEVKDKVDAIRSELPEDVEAPTIVKFDINALPIMDLAVSSSRPLSETFEMADNEIKDELSKVEGVASIDIIGGKEREIVFAVERAKLRAYDVSILDVIAAVASENLTIPVGRITESRREYTIRAIGEFQDVESMRNMRIRAKNGSMIKATDLGQVLDTFKDQRELARFNREESVGIVIQKRSDANTVKTAAGIRETITNLDESFPDDVKIDVARDRATFIEDSVQDAIVNIFIGVLLTSILLYLFLHNWKGMVIAAVAMPTSIISTFLLIDFGGFTINVMTLMALGISIGVLVTNAIVVLENIVRHVNKGDRPDVAAERGTGEIALAVIASTMTNVVVFTPIAFMKGIIGQFFLQFGMTVVFATLFSLIVSFTLTPMLASKLLKPETEREKDKDKKSFLDRFAEKWDEFYDNLSSQYKEALVWCLGHRSLTAAGVTAIFFFSMFLFRFIGGEFIPQSDAGLVSIVIEMPPGTSLEETNLVLNEIEDIVLNLPETESVLATLGGERKGVEDGEVVVQMIPLDERDKSIEEFMNELRPLLATIPAVDVSVNAGGGGRDVEADLVMEITGTDLDRLKEVSNQVRDIAQGVEGLVDVKTSWKRGKPEIAFYPDRGKMAVHDLMVSDVAASLRASFEGEEASVYREKDEEYDIRVRLAEKDRNHQAAARQIAIKSDGYFIPITELGKVELTEGKSEILRKDKQRLIKVTANISKGSEVELENKIKEKSNLLNLPAGYNIHFGGRSETREESFGSIFTALILAIILTYMVLAAILESYVHPFTIMITLPLGLIGTSFALFLTGKTINILSLMAVVMLVGIVVNNAILLLDYTHVLRDRGLGIKEALLEACPVRLRPIIMTNLAIVIGMLPQALGGAGVEFRVSMAVVTMGGVFFSAIFTLFLIPVIYITLDRLTKRGREEATRN